MHSQVVITKNQVLIYNRGRGLLFEEIRYTRNVNQKNAFYFYRRNIQASLSSCSNAHHKLAYRLCK